MTLVDLLVFCVALYLVIYLIRIVPLPKPGGTPPRSLEWVRTPLICVVVLLAIIYLVQGGHASFLNLHRL
jgi:hypothetical protein